MPLLGAGSHAPRLPQLPHPTCVTRQLQPLRAVSAPRRSTGNTNSASVQDVRGEEIVMVPLGRPNGAGEAPSNSTYGVAPANSGGANGRSSAAISSDPANGTSANGTSSPAAGNGLHNKGGSGSGGGNGGKTYVTLSEQGRNGVVLSRSPPPGVVVARQKVLPAAQAAAGQVAQSGLLSGRAPAYYFADEDEADDRPDDADFEWAQESYSETKRSVDIWTFALFLRLQLFLLDKKWAYAGGMTDEKRIERTRWLAVYVRESILKLGPTFIKIGQLFSTRSDLFPAEFTAELSKLQDRVPAFNGDKAVAVVERELGAPISTLFRSFDKRPIAAASLGQVHRAVLHSGEQVVVKVQRPGLKRLFDIDLRNLKVLAKQIDATDESGRSDLSGIYSECEGVLYKEIDYILEGRSADRFRRNFRGTPWVRVPVVHWQYCSPTVLTLEYLPGTKITNMSALEESGIDVRTVARRATESYLIQILRHGFFHADPHPGNIAVDPQGRLIFYDMGMMGEIKPTTRETLLETFYAFYRKDADGVVKALTALGIIVPTGDAMAVRRALQFFIDNLSREVERGEAVAVIGEDLFAIAVDQPFRFPATFTFVLRAFSTLEGIGKALDADYKFVSVAQPYAQELLDVQNQSFVLDEVRRQAAEFGGAAAAMPLRVAKMDGILNSLEAGDLKVRVRVLEAERAARRAGVMQLATLHSVGALGFLNVGAQMALAGATGPAVTMFTVSGVFSVLVALAFRRVKRLDKFEQGLKNGGSS